MNTTASRVNFDTARVLAVANSCRLLREQAEGSVQHLAALLEFGKRPGLGTPIDASLARAFQHLQDAAAIFSHGQRDLAAMLEAVTGNQPSAAEVIP